MHPDTHQGNVFNKNDVWLIQEGDTKFHVETVLGTPAIKDLLHPNRVQYVEQVKEVDSGAAYTRGVIIDYDDALRVKHLERFGFKE
jgi:outer membrane protein assembly factor BamE (lipoprotein component of BamABCDE complex)